MRIVTILLIFFLNFYASASENSGGNMPDHEWSFEGITGTFDKAALQRGFKVYREICSGCHSMRLLYYRDLIDIGFNEEEVKVIASDYTVVDGPNDEGEMFTRPARLSDKFVGPYANEQAATAANGGAYPPDMSVLVKARQGGADYIYSVLMGYEDPPSGITLDDGVYYNKFMSGNNIMMAKPLFEGMVQYSDGTSATEKQMAKDVVSFLMWTAEPHLELRHKFGFRVIIYLIIISVLVYFIMKKIWSRIESKV